MPLHHPRILGRLQCGLWPEQHAALAHQILSRAESSRPGELQRAARRAARAYSRWNEVAPAPERAALAREWADAAEE